MRLICEADPVTIPGLVQPDGAWSLPAFEQHVRACATCRSFSGRLTAEVGAQLRGGREAGLPQINASAELVIREVIDILDASRHTFRSKQIQRAKQLLDALLRAQAGKDHP